MVATKPYTPMGRVWRALQLADMLDASGITSASGTSMDDAQWCMLATAAGIRRIPSLLTRNLTTDMLRSREDTPSQLQPLAQRRTHATTNETPGHTIQVVQIPRPRMAVPASALSHAP